MTARVSCSSPTYVYVVQHWPIHQHTFGNSKTVNLQNSAHLVGFKDFCTASCFVLACVNPFPNDYITVRKTETYFLSLNLLTLLLIQFQTGNLKLIIGHL